MEEPRCVHVCTDVLRTETRPPRALGSLGRLGQWLPEGCACCACSCAVCAVCRPNLVTGGASPLSSLAGPGDVAQHQTTLSGARRAGSSMHEAASGNLRWALRANHTHCAFPAIIPM